MTNYVVWCIKMTNEYESLGATYFPVLIVGIGIIIFFKWLFSKPAEDSLKLVIEHECNVVDPSQHKQQCNSVEPFLGHKCVKIIETAEECNRVVLELIE